MAELITYLIALPLLYGIGLFYWRVACGLWRAVRRPASPATCLAELPHDWLYDTALATAKAIIHQWTTRPNMAPHERLATVTYAVLEALHRLEEQSGSGGPQPSIN